MTDITGNKDLCMETADALETQLTDTATLRAQLFNKDIELQAMRNAANQFKRDLARVTAERDAAIKDIEAMMSEADEPLCSYCANVNDAVRCGAKWRGCNAMWRGLPDYKPSEEV